MKVLLTYHRYCVHGFFWKEDKWEMTEPAMSDLTEDNLSPKITSSMSKERFEVHVMSLPAHFSLTHTSSENMAFSGFEKSVTCTVL